MHEVELVLVSLLVAVAGLAAAARATNIPYPIVLVIGGLRTPPAAAGITRGRRRRR